MKTTTTPENSKVTPRFLPVYARPNTSGHDAGGIITQDTVFTVLKRKSGGKKNPPILLLAEKPGFEYDSSSFLAA